MLTNVCLGHKSAEIIELLIKHGADVCKVHIFLKYSNLNKWFENFDENHFR